MGIALGRIKLSVDLSLSRGKTPDFRTDEPVHRNTASVEGAASAKRTSSVGVCDGPTDQVKSLTPKNCYGTTKREKSKFSRHYAVVEQFVRQETQPNKNAEANPHGHLSEVQLDSRIA